jgi:hypothetical protein
LFSLEFWYWWETQPHGYSGGVVIYLIHEADLRITLQSVVLIDANRIDPKIGPWHVSTLGSLA